MSPAAEPASKPSKTASARAKTGTKTATKNKTGPRKRGRGADTEQMKRDLTTAAFDSLREDGFRGSTARAIATRAGCNQAAIYYHFGGIEELWLHALRESSQRRLARYQERLAGQHELAPLVAALDELYTEDLASGHLDVLSELMGGVTANPEIAGGIADATEPWLQFVEEQVREASQHHPWGTFVPAADAADLIFSLVLGMQIRSRVDGRTDRAERLFRLAGLGAAIADRSAS